MIMDCDKFIESKIAFINEFLKSTRPSFELADFMKAFDTCKPTNYEEIMPIPPVDEQHIDFVPQIPEEVVAQEPIGENEQEEKPKRYNRRTKNIVLHDGTKMNVHPASKMVKVSFFDRDTYYSSVTAASQALGVSLNAIKRAATKGSLINGHNVEYVDPSELRSAPKKG